MIEAIMWISLTMNAIILIGFAVSFFLASKRTHDVKYFANNLGFVSITGTVNNDKTARFLKAKNRVILKENARIKSENKRISFLALFFMLLAVLMSAVKDEVIKKQEQNPQATAEDKTKPGVQ